MSSFLYVTDQETRSKINLDDLYERQQRKDQKQVSIFNKLLNRIHQKIKLTARNHKEDRFVFCTIPEYIFGESVYNQADCIAYLVDKLEDNGFHIRYIHPNTLLVSWAHIVPSYVRNEVKKRLGIVIDQNGQMVDKLEDNREEDLNDRLFVTKRGGGGAAAADQDANGKTRREFTPMENYKPVGIYDREFLDRMEQKTVQLPPSSSRSNSFASMDRGMNGEDEFGGGGRSSSSAGGGSSSGSGRGGMSVKKRVGFY